MNCKNNEINILNLNENLEYLYCGNNKIEKLILPNKLKILVCENCEKLNNLEI